MKLHIQMVTFNHLPEGHTFQPALDPVHVPEGSHPIEVVQYWRGELKRGHPYPLHWAIVVRTASDRGNAHEIVGDTHTYTTQDRFDVPLYPSNEWRGAHVVGYVAPHRMDDLWNHIALTPVVRHRSTWNCQNWVCDVLERVKGPPGELYVDERLSLDRLRSQMVYLLEAWEVGDI